MKQKKDEQVMVSHYSRVETEKAETTSWSMINSIASTIHPVKYNMIPIGCCLRK
jgi:hypothetical protein